VYLLYGVSGLGYCCREDCSYIISTTTVPTYYFIILYTLAAEYNVVRQNDIEIHLTDTALVIK